MKQHFLGLKPIYQIVILNLLGGIIINIILQSNLLTNGKISLSIIVGVVIGIAIIAIFQKAFRRQQEEHIELMDAQFENYFISLKELADNADNEVENHCAALEQQIKIFESNNAAFPLAVAKDYTIYSVLNTATKPFYDSDWVIAGEYNNELFACHITRKDTETVQNIITLIKNTSCPNDIWSLDEYDEIYPGEEKSA